jgi:hypothetical protein
MSDTLSAAAIATSQDEKIRQRAYEIWENEGRTGNPEGHWFRAQQELANQGQVEDPAQGSVSGDFRASWLQV